MGEVSNDIKEKKKDVLEQITAYAELMTRETTRGAIIIIL